MDCNNYKDKLADYVKNNLEHAQKELVEKHIRECPECGREVKIMKNLFLGFKAISREELPYGFDTRLHQKLLDAGEEIKMTNLKKEISNMMMFRLWRYSLASVAVFVIIIGGIFYIKPGRQQVVILQDSNSLVSNISDYNSGEYLEVGREGVLRLKIRAKNRMENVSMEISIPEGISVSGEDDAKLVHWNGSLNSGENTIYLRVRGVREGDWPVAVKIMKNGNEKTIETPFKVVKI